MTAPKPGEKVLVQCEYVVAHPYAGDSCTVQTLGYEVEVSAHLDDVLPRSAFTALCEAAGEILERPHEGVDLTRLRSALAAVGGKSNG